LWRNGAESSSQVAFKGGGQRAESIHASGTVVSSVKGGLTVALHWLPQATFKA